ncbi:hypothetical protein WT83_04860 [Burkholderia territorii]|uniref:Uncharacterized protein n=1 Tax=Burkholderia territorii TaxID=1503055 RepID=A0A108F2P9_9BURK|nr:hypothetical protein [Burkholderia territorii]KWN22005.1 hypothetical protein WT83_04860 [Burkholderia territorii]
MSALIAYVASTWVRLDDEADWRMPDYPAVSDAAVVISDFGADALTGEIELEGSPVHAPALISRKLAAQGAADGETRVLIHALQKSSSRYQAIYTAINLAQWQRLMQWRQARPRVCLMVPVMSLLWRQVGPNRGVVAHSGRQLILLAQSDKRLIHCTTVGFSESVADLETAARALGERVRAELAVTPALGEDFKVVWHVVLSKVDSDESRPTSEALAGAFVDATGLNVELAPSQILGGEGAAHLESSLPSLWRAHSFLASVNPLTERISWGLERWAWVWSGLMCSVALVSLIVAGGLFARVHRVNNEAAQIRMQAEALHEQIVQLKPQTVMPTGFDAWSQELIAQQVTQKKFDVERIVKTVGNAAHTSGVAILRIYTVSPPVGKGRPDVGGRPSPREPEKLLVVDGATPAGGDGAQVDKLARFVQALRAAGWVASSVDTIAGHVEGNLLAKVFSYRLTPAVSAAREKQ